MRELKVGDKVKIRRDLVEGKRYRLVGFNSAMIPLKGKEVEISYIDEDGDFKVKGGNDRWFSREMIEEPTTDAVNSPSHYLHGGIETIEVIRMMLTPEEFKGYCKGNIIKYRERAPYKGREEEDYAKARKYKEFLDDANKE